MAVPSSITDLNVSAPSNSPAGSDSIGTSLDEYLRAIQSILRREQAQGSAIPSASTVNIGSTTDGNYVHITGTTAITSFGTVAAGVSRTVVFDGALTLTHNATSLILPGAVNITTAAGDVGKFVSEGSGNWRCVRYLKADGAPVVAGDIAVQIHAATSKATPVDADEIPLVDSAASFGLKKLTWANLKAALQAALTGFSNAAGVLFTGGAFGYGTGAGGTVTQATSKSTAVTLNKPSGQITMNGASLAAGATVAFTLNNSVINAADTLGLKVFGGFASTGSYQVWAENAGAGVIVICVKNNTAGALAEALVIQFSVIKGAVS